MDIKQINHAIERSILYHTKLVLVTGKAAHLLLENTASTEGLVVINLGLELSKKLIKVPRQGRAKASALLFADLLNQRNTHVLLLNHIEILFDKTLSIEPLKLLQSSAKNLTLVVAWPGEKTNTLLTYAMPSHPEYRCYKASDFGETIFVDAGKNG